MLYLRTLGDFRLTTPDGNQIPLRGRGAGLLLYLVHASPGDVDRDELAWLLWDATPNSSTRHSLSQLLYKLRSTVPGLAMVAKPTSVRIDKTAVRYDLREFISHVSRGEYKEAAECYTGPFMSICGNLAGRNFEDWRGQTSREVQQKIVAILSHLAKNAEVAGDWNDALSYARRLVEADPLNEAGNLIKLRLLAATEPSVAAATEVLRLRDTYAEWAEPIPASLQSLVASIEGHSADGNQSEPEPPKFVGRGTEFGILCRCWSRAESRVAQLVQVLGVPGVGKTRLVERFLRWTALKGARILEANCSPPEQRLAYSTATSAWSNGIRIEDLVGLAPGWRRHIAPLLPGLDPALEHLPTAVEVDHRTVLEANGRLISGIADRQPVVVFIDNANWLDDSSARLLHYLYHKLGDRRLVFVLALRAREPVASDHLRSLFESADSQAFTTIEVDPLDHDDALALLSSEADRTGILISGDVQRDIILESKGVPFHLLYRLKEAAADRNRHRSGATYLSESDLTSLAEIRLLSPGARRTVEALAVLGRSSTVEMVGQILGEAEGSTMLALMELVQRDLVRVDGKRVSFVHDIIHERVLASIDNSRREDLHARAARTLREQLTARAALVTLHFAAAGRDEAAAKNALLAAEEALIAFAFKDAEFFYQLAINKAPDPQLRTEATAAYIDYLSGMGRFDDALSWLERWRASAGSSGTHSPPRTLQLLELYRASIAGDSTLDLIAQVSAMNSAGRPFADEVGYRMLRILLQVAHVAGRAPSREQLSRYIEQNLPQLVTSKAGCELLSVLARCWALYVDSERASELASIALSSAERLRDPTVILTCMVSRATVRMVRGELYGAEQDFDSVLNHAENPDFVHFRQRILNNFGLVLLERGKLAEANSRLLEALAFVSGPDQVMIRANLTLVSLEDGALSEVARRVQDLERSNSLLQAGWAVLFASTIRGWIALLSGRMRDAADCMRGSAEALADSALMMDSSYSESLIARITAQEDPIAAAAYCDQRGAVHRRRYVLGSLRLALEGARSLRLIAPQGARTRAHAVLAEAEALGASNIARQAVALLSESVD